MLSDEDAPKTRTVPLSAGTTALEYGGLHLKVIEGPDAGLEATFDSRSIEIGTATSCDLRLSDRTVSRHHCLIEVREEGYRLQDLGSRNGTRISGCRIGWAVLRPGVSFHVGGSRLCFDVAGERHRIDLSTRAQFGRMVGRSAAMRELYAMLQKIAASDTTVLVEAESGSGKELAAEAIHAASRRAAAPFEVFDCASIPGNLIESELFGHERGAFTGATARHAGAFERAAGGTLFLDEIGELPEALQPRLLRVLESRQYRPVGGNRLLTADVRVIAATNRDLPAMVKEGRFRLDLYHRLAVVQVRIPPLRHRVEDIPLLVDHFLEEYRREGRDAPPVSQEALARLQTYSWPGNVRELRNFVERGVVLGRDLGDLPFLDTTTLPGGTILGVTVGLPAEGPLPVYHVAKSRMVDEWERTYCERLLKEHGGNVAAAARAAGMNRKSLMYLLAKHGLRDYRQGHR